MKKSLILAGMLAVGYANAQEGNVGINTETPKATLEVLPSAKNLAGTTNEGIIIPKLTKARVLAIATDKLVEGTKVYVTDEVTAADTQFIGTGKGFYFYNGTKWVKQLASDTNAGSELWAQRNNAGVTETYLVPANNDDNDLYYTNKGVELNIGGVTKEDLEWANQGTYAYGTGMVPNNISLSSSALPENSDIGANNGQGAFIFTNNNAIIKENHAGSGILSGNKGYTGYLQRAVVGKDVTSNINEVTAITAAADILSNNSKVNTLTGILGVATNGTDRNGSTTPLVQGGYFRGRNMPSSTTTNLFGLRAITNNYGDATNITGGLFYARSADLHGGMGITTYPATNINNLQGIRVAVDNRENSTSNFVMGSYVSSGFENNSKANYAYNQYARTDIRAGATITEFTNMYGYVRADYGLANVTHMYNLRLHTTFGSEFKPTNNYGLYIHNVNNGTDANYSIYTNEGQIRFGDLKGTGDRVVYADEKGVLKTGESVTATNGIQNQSAIKCDATNAGKINYTTIQIEGEEKGVFGFCMQKGTEYVWAYMVGGANIYGTSANGAAFGDGL